MRIDGDHPRSASIRARELQDIKQGIDEPLSKQFLAGQISLDCEVGGLMTEGKEPPHGGEQRRGAGGHEQQEIDQLGDPHGVVKILKTEMINHNLPSLSMDGLRRDRMKTTHKQLLLKK
jgi:hypothetical protein